MSIARRALTLTNRLVEPAAATVFGVTTAVRTQSRVAALTFDDGPDPEYTPRLLDLLAHFDAKATFFVLGSQAAAQPELIARIRDEGHAFGNHTWSHASLPRLASSARRRELMRPHDELDVDLGDLMRPPYGHFDASTWLDVLRLGLRPIAWSGHAKDWCLLDEAALLQRLRRGLLPGAILLLHDRLHDWEQRAFTDRGPMLAALEEFLATDGLGWRFVTVPKLLALGPARRRLWWKRGEDAWLAGLRAATDG